MHTLHNYIYVFSILCYNRKVNNVDLKQIKAVAFDIDGTLYRAWKFNLRIAPYFLSHSIFFLKYGLVRSIMHKTEATNEFIKVQASHMAKKLNCTPEEAQQRLEKVIYKGLEKYFVNIKPCKGSIEFIKKLKEKGYKIGLLSDFPPEQKGSIWGIRDMCDVVLGSEEAGALRTAWLILPHLGWLGKKSKAADFTFWHYNQLDDWFFGKEKDNNSDSKSD